MWRQGWDRSALLLLLLVAILGSVVGGRGGGGGGRGGGGRWGSSGGSRWSGGSSGGWSSGGARGTYTRLGGTSRSSGGFGQGLGGGLLIGYSLGRLSSPGYYGYGYGYGHNYGQYRRDTSGYRKERPLTCYTGSLLAEIDDDLELNETAVQCNYAADVCFGRVVLHIINSTESSTGFLQVEKGCGQRSLFEADFRSRGSFNSGSQCFVSSIRNTTSITNNYFGGNSSLDLTTSDTQSLVATSQEELCICDGSYCNTARISQPLSSHLLSLVLVQFFGMFFFNSCVNDVQ